jgi:4-carboxymuconolactone decarboxylase
MPRITPISTKDQVPPEHHAAFDQVAALRGRISGPSGFLMYSPQLNLAHSAVSAYFLKQSVIPERLQEVAILTTVREKEVAYAWGAHVASGRKAGVPETVIQAVRARGGVAGLEPDDAAIVTYARQLVRNGRAEQSAFDQLHAKFGTQWLVEMTALIGHYGYIGTILNAFELEPGPDADRLPKP